MNTDWEGLSRWRDEDIVFNVDAPRTEAADWLDAVAHHGLGDPSFHAALHVQKRD